MKLTIADLPEVLKTLKAAFLKKPPKPLLPNATKSKTTSKKRMTKWKAKAKLDLKNKIIDLRKRTK